MTLTRTALSGEPAALPGLQQVPAAVLGAVLAVPLAGYAAIGSFARYTADDFCWAGVLRTEGFFRAQALWYVGYSPRYAFTFLVNLVELAGPAIVPALPTVAILVWLATLTWTCTRFRLRLGQLSTTTSAVLLAEVATFGTLQTAPDLPQSLYWQTGMLTYLLPLVLATFLVGWIRQAYAQRRLQLWTVAVSGLVTFVAGGLSETYLIPQNVALTLALLVAIAIALRGDQALVAPTKRGGAGLAAEAQRAERAAPAQRGEARWVVPSLWGEVRWVVPVHLAGALTGGVLALLVIVVAPSTASRVGGTPAELGLTLAASVATGWYQVLRLLRFFPLSVVLSVGLPALLGDASARISRRWFGVISVIAAVTATFCYFPSFYAQNGNPPTRSLIVPGAIFIGYLMFVGYSLQALTRRIPAQARLALAVVLALAPVGVVAAGLADQLSAAQSAAATWDAEDLQIRATRDAGQTDVVVPQVPPFLGEQFVTTNRQDWFNICVARYYDVRSIATAASPTP